MKIDFRTFVSYEKRHKSLTVKGHTYQCRRFLLSNYYLLELLRTHHIKRPYEDINFIDYKLLDRLKLRPEQLWKHLFSDYVEIGILTKTEDFIPNTKSARYSLNAELFHWFYMEVLGKYGLNRWISAENGNSSMDTYYLPLNYSQNLQEFYYTDEEELMNWLNRDTFMELTEAYISTGRYYDEIADTDRGIRLYPVIKHIRNNDKFEANRWFFNKGFDQTDEEIIKAEHVNKMLNAPMMKMVLKDYEYLRESGVPVYMTVRATIEGNKDKRVVQLTGRPYHEEALIHKEERHLDGHFDLHSSYMTVNRLLKTGEFDIDWDLKSVLEKNYYFYTDGTVLERADFKRRFGKNNKGDSILYRIYFSKGFRYIDSEYKQYRKICVENNQPYLSLDEYKRLYVDVQNIIGESYDIGKSICFYEAAIVFRAMRKLVEMGKQTSSAFDCIYFDPNEISEEGVKKIITESAFEMYREVTNAE